MVGKRFEEDESDSLFASCVDEQMVPKDLFLVKLLTGLHLDGGARVVPETQ